MKCAVLICLVCSLPMVADSPGIRPRADAANYPANRDTANFSIGAYVVPPDQAKKMFKFDLTHAGYVVVEVGVFPAPGKDVDLYPTDFTLAIGDELVGARPVMADTIAEIVAGRPEPPKVGAPGGVNTAASASIGHGSYTDPVTGRRVSGTETSTDVGVGVGGPAQMPCRTNIDCEDMPRTTTAPPIMPSPTQNANMVAQELWERSLPDGKTAHAVAGYLYFPRPSRKAKKAIWELRYENADGKTRLSLAR
ncbi:MAG TPA: hypothetical protein VHZ55_23450 [Bryobacteraceae bacterium]|jgi:hypothetical protein|nr:hypothetical protein [Bryobacteraceae bacterium]